VVRRPPVVRADLLAGGEDTVFDVEDVERIDELEPPALVQDPAC